MRENRANSCNIRARWVSEVLRPTRRIDFSQCSKRLLFSGSLNLQFPLVLPRGEVQGARSKFILQGYWFYGYSDTTRLGFWLHKIVAPTICMKRRLGVFFARIIILSYGI